MGIEIYVSPSNPEPGQTVRCYWNYTNTWTKGYSFKIDFYLDGRLIKTVNLGYLSPGQSKEGSFSFTAPSTSGTHTLKAVSYLYTYEQWVNDDEATATFMVGKIDMTTILMQELKKWYKNNLGISGADWSFDVTEMVKKVYPDITKATLYGWYRIEGYTYAGKERPPDRDPRDIVKGWEAGIELALLNIGTDVYNIPEEYAGWYWVTVPCKLEIKRAEPKAKIEKIEVKEYTTGKVYTVSNGGTVNVGEERVRITATVRNIGSVSGTIYVELLVNGVSKGIRTLSLSPYSSSSTYWDIELTQGSHTVTIRAGH